MKEETTININYIGGLIFSTLSCIFGGLGIAITFRSYLFGFAFSVCSGMISLGILLSYYIFANQSINKGMAKKVITREIYYKPIKLPEKPRRRK